MRNQRHKSCMKPSLIMILYSKNQENSSMNLNINNLENVYRVRNQKKGAKIQFKYSRINQEIKKRRRTRKNDL
jgi:hypothetical protein